LKGPFIGPELAYRISAGVAKKTLRAWVKRDDKKHWSLQQDSNIRRASFKNPLQEKVSELLELNSDRLRWMTGLLSGHCNLKRHLFK
jgi:hypothetical protein